LGIPPYLLLGLLGLVVLPDVPLLEGLLLEGLLEGLLDGLLLDGLLLLAPPDAPEPDLPIAASHS